MNQFEAADQLEELAKKLRELKESLSENRASALIDEQVATLNSSADLIDGLAALNRITPVEPKSRFIPLKEAQDKRALAVKIIGDGDKPGSIPLPPFISHRMVRFRADQLAALASFRDAEDKPITAIRIYPGLELGVNDQGNPAFFYTPILAAEDKNGKLVLGSTQTDRLLTRIINRGEALDDGMLCPPYHCPDADQLS